MTINDWSLIISALASLITLGAVISLMRSTRKMARLAKEEQQRLEQEAQDRWDRR